MKKEIGFIGLGKMGKPMVWRLRRKRWNVFTFDTKVRGNAGSLPELVKKTVPPRIIWLMIPAGKLVDQVLRSLTPLLNKGDVVIDGGNSFFKDSAKRAAVLKRKGIFYLDVGISGGPISIKQGRFAVMVGGEKRIYEKTRPLFRALSDTRSGYMGKSGAGHFAKMVHNGIEYGMLQSLAEGFALLKKAPFRFSLKDVAKAYNQNSIITSRLTNWLQEGFERYGEDLARVSGTVAHTGEGEWTLKTARELGIATPVIKEALDFRIKSKKSPSFTGKILSTLRAVFGGHSVNPNEKR
ncbi:MAG: 6-phosphogluconate dehydrogenase (decarboxylating) [Candidatus Wildermuthbacteria bacterium RIFCSPHIGHO2_02_FULL_49_9]|uniref:6-phosphogluconate dehydrogenase (Decarboxylating) n=2 Tax=Candidatus Wildermuthiibacteriota TaxID=1817923 RepID=A0A1G2QZ09_9BACT|nr:MAG: 6-phosphogluconate dehydrogenase (decarboxylating) [Candidatus Wildermuthbacteria bacterium RIFCSPHIGHO2_01_FULL_49_22b]OHA71066.1 MAG: 6-phosphogluconate dehydrogenase (decarboxylating) [Candidatus Wildermuthbacteria bacterium RIFCSPHIGHO2_02_FULL_49_9]